HGATQQQVFDRPPLYGDLRVVRTAEVAVLRITVAERQIQRVGEQNVLEDRDQDFRVGFLDVVAAADRRHAAGANVADAGGVGDLDRVGNRLAELLAVAHATGELHGAGRKFEQVAVDFGNA